MKKTAFLIIFSFFINMVFPCSLQSFAAEQSEIVITKTVKDWDSSAPSETPAILDGKPYVSFNRNDTQVYTVNISQPGVYEMSMLGGNGNSTNVAITAILLDGNECMRANFPNTGGYNEFKSILAGYLNLSIGEHTITLQHLYQDIHFSQFSLRRVSDETETKKLLAAECNAENTTGTYDSDSDTLTLASTEYADFNVSVEKSGLYRMNVVAYGLGEASISVYTDGEEQSVFPYIENNAAKIHRGYNEMVISLNSGENTVRIRNTGLEASKLIVKYFTLERFDNLKNVSVGSDTVITADDVSTRHNANILNDEFVVFASGSICIPITVENEGFYRVEIPGAIVQLAIDGNAIAQFPGMAYVFLEAGKHNLCLSAQGEETRFQELLFTYLPNLTSDCMQSFTQEVNLCTASDELENKLAEYASVFGTDTESVTDGIFEKQFIYRRMLNVNYSDAAQVWNTFKEASDAERMTPTLSLRCAEENLSQLQDGDLTLSLLPGVVADNVNVCAALYSDNRLDKVALCKNNGTDTLELTWKGVKIDPNKKYRYRLIALGGTSTLAPYEYPKKLFREYFVSADAQPGGTGSEEQPFSTLSAAKDAIAEVSGKMTGDIVVNVLHGTYFLEETEIFTEEHGGHNGYRVIVRSAEPQKPAVFSGGIEITDWTESDGVWYADYSGNGNVRNLYVNGYPAERANNGFLCTCEEITEDGVVISADNLPESFSSPEDMETVWELMWSQQRIPVTNVQKRSDGKLLLSLLQPCFNVDWSIAATKITVGTSFYLENDKSLLDKGGEFCFDSGESRIYYYPREGETIDSFKATVSETEGLFEISGINKKVENLTFENLEFCFGAWNEPSEKGYRSIQADCIWDGNSAERNVDTIPAQLTVKNADNITIDGCRLYCLESSGIAAEENVTNSIIRGNILRDISATGIRIGKFTNTESNMCKNVAVTDNSLRRTGYEYRNCAGVSTYYEQNISILHNRIEEVPYSGISAGWGWGGKQPFNVGGYTISGNFITDVMNTMDDGGGIYVLGKLRNSVISENYISDTHRISHPLYADSGSAYFSFRENFVENCDKYLQVGSICVHDVQVIDNHSTSDVMTAENSHFTHIGFAYEDTENISPKAVAIRENAGPRANCTHAESLDLPNGIASIIKTVPKLPFVSGLYIDALSFSHRSTNGARPINDYLEFNTNGWAEYQIEIEKSGTYSICVYACRDSSDAADIKINDGNDVFVQGGISPTGSWQTVHSHSIGDITLESGTHTIRITSLSGGFHMEGFTLTKN